MPDAEIGELHPGGHRADGDLRAERNHGDRNQRQHHGHKRRQQIEELVDVRREHAFLGDQLHHVGQRLQQSVRSHAIRTHAQLDVRDHFALDPLQVCERGEQHEGDHRHLDEAEYIEIRRSSLVTYGRLPEYNAPGASSTEFSFLE